ncbi:MAG: hypothetical protein DCC56_12110 [Anaerolineae bacterium]|nr:MAG: hypothetical protein DCC56_12110 [Anaerolineae bacterium]WKZ42306.1 MAG: hypothetical protein QY302_09380 [Anaerolineales bacterium]
MSKTVVITDNQLTNFLHALGVKFIMGGQREIEALHDQPALLIAALAESGDARLRLSLIPLFLEHPEFSNYVQQAAKRLDPSARLTLQCYYSAAVWLGQKIQLKNSMPDYFSKELGLHVAENVDENLQELAQRHKELSGAQINWLGTYEHAARIWLKGLELQKA